MNIEIEFCFDDDSRLEGYLARCLHNLKRDKYLILISKKTIDSSDENISNYNEIYSYVLDKYYNTNIDNTISLFEKENNDKSKK